MKFSNGGMLYPFPPILDSFHQKIFSSTLQRRLQRASVSKNKVFGFVQDDELFFQQVTDGDIGGKPDGFVHAMIINMAASAIGLQLTGPVPRSEEHTSELQSLMRISYAVFCLKKKKIKKKMMQNNRT